MSNLSIARQKMVDCQVRPSDVTDIRIIEAMQEVPREAFVPASKQALAYLDLDLDVSDASSAKRFLIAPAATAKMLQAADIRVSDSVLVVGCATGYVAALVAKLAARVTAIESVSGLAEKAKVALDQVKLTNVTVRCAPAAEGDRAGGPYDVIVLNGATEIRPDGLYGQLKEGGRLVGVFATSAPPRAMIVTHTEGDYGSRPLFDAVAPVLPGLERTPAFVF